MKKIIKQKSARLWGNRRENSNRQLTEKENPRASEAEIKLLETWLLKKTD